MNKDQTDSAHKGAQGSGKEQVGKPAGSPKREGKNLVKQAEARLQKAHAEVKEALKNSRHS